MNIELTEDAGVLKPGDEIAINQGSEMRYYRVEEIPRVSKLKTWHNGKTRYIAVKCRAAMTQKTVSGINNWNNKPWTNTYKTYEFRVPNENDPIVKVDLNWKQIIITKKSEEWTQ
jgi:hypothetical protein